MEPANRHRQIDELRAIVSAGICRVLNDRILVLKPFGLASLWVNADSNDEFNAGTVLGYSSDDWKSIQLYSGLWKSNGHIKSKEIWEILLGVTINHRMMGTFRTKWFCFGEKFSDQRLNRRNNFIDDHLVNSTPGDEISLGKIREFYSIMESRIVHYGTRFSRELRDLIRDLKIFEDDQIEEAQTLLTESGFDDLQSSNPKSKLENEFEEADEATQAKIVEQYLLRTQV